jgi:hypothetical protein
MKLADGILQSASFHDRSVTMKRLKQLSVCLAAMLFGSPAFADTWAEGSITEIRVIWSNTSADGVLVLGTFPSLGCPNSGFMLFSADGYFKESYAALLAAKVSGARVKILDWYCMPNGYARGNGYAIAQ